MSIRRSGKLDLRKLQSADTLTVRGLFARSQIAGRDGSVAYSGGTGGGVICPWTGATIAAGDGCSYDLPLPGVGTIKMYHAQGARTNLAQYSESASDASWGTVAATKTNTISTSPTGSANALLLTADGSSSSHYIVVANTLVSYTSGISYTSSIYVRAVSATFAQITMPAAPFGSGQHANINLSNGAVTQVGCIASATRIASGWWRLTITATATASVFGGAVVVSFVTNGGSVRVESNTLATSMLIWGGQTEQSSFPGLYIPTAGASVARTADVWTWTPSVSLSTSAGSLTSIFVPYLWGTTYPDTGPLSLLESAAGFPRLKAGSAGGNNIEFQMRDSGAIVQQSGSSSGLPSAGQVSVHEGIWTNSGYINDSRNGVLGSQAGPYSVPWTVDGSVVAISATAGRIAHGLQAIIYTPGGCTQIEREALYRLANRTLVPVA